MFLHITNLFAKSNEEYLSDPYTSLYYIQDDPSEGHFHRGVIELNGICSVIFPDLSKITRYLNWSV